MTNNAVSLNHICIPEGRVCILVMCTSDDREHKTRFFFVNHICIQEGIYQKCKHAVFSLSG